MDTTKTTPFYELWADCERMAEELLRAEAAPQRQGQVAAPPVPQILVPGGVTPGGDGSVLLVDGQFWYWAGDFTYRNAAGKVMTAQQLIRLRDASSTGPR